MIIDCHGQFTTAPPALGKWRGRQIKAYEASRFRILPGELIIDDDEIVTAIEGGQLKRQRDRGTDLTLLSPDAGKAAQHYGDARTSLHWSQVSNDLIARASGLFPGRFAGVCQLPQSPGEALASSIGACVTELRRCVEELGFVGCLLNPDPSDGYWQAPPLTDPVYHPLFEALVELDVPAMVHVATSRNPAVPGGCAHYLNGATAVFMQLCQSRLFEDFPSLRLILPYGGGAVPYHWGRYRGVMLDQGRPPLEEALLGNVFFDTRVVGKRGLELLTDVIPAENILLASDTADTKAILDSLDTLTGAGRAAIYGENALRVFPRLRKLEAAL